tara:strand:- start:39 stop:710 length:672 start_codon:yes stop_codon:yes gene_type:complete
MYKNKKITALLPFKKNSERVPNKNFKELNLKPLYKWMLDKLNNIKEIDEIIINTDAYDILEEDLSKKPKVNLKKRPESICGDMISMNRIIQNDLEESNSEIFIMTHTTNPFLEEKTIINALNNFMTSDADSLFTVNKFQTRFYDRNSTPINHNLSDLKRTQDLEPYYEENSCLYIFSKKSFNSSKNRIGKNPMMKVISKLESLDIDDKQDWDLAELLAKSLNN